MQERKANFVEEKARYHLGDTGRYIDVDVNDFNIPVRLNECIENITKYCRGICTKHGIKDVNDIPKSKNSEMTIEELKDIDEYVRGQIDYVFGDGASNIAFGRASAISVTLKGEYYFENFINALIPLIEEDYKIRIKKIDTRVKKYTNLKGQHPALRK